MSLFNLFKKQTPENSPSNNKEMIDNSFYTQKQPKLPENFAQSVMDLEMRLQFVESYDLQAVQQLNELYKIGIEYYINIDPKKANHFQRKLTTLFTNPQTLQLIDQGSKKKTNTNEPEKHGAGYDKNLKMELNKFNAQSELMIKSMIEGSEKKNERKTRMIDENLSKQENILMRRLERRSRSKSAKRKNLDAQQND